MNRYPDIAFLMHIAGDLPAATLSPTPMLDLHDVEILYLFGASAGADFLHSWLAEKPQHALVFLEDDLAKVAALPEELVEHPQIHLYYIHEGKWDAVLEECAQRFPTEKIAIHLSLGADSAYFEERKLALMRASGALSALYSDVLYTHKLLPNIIANSMRLSDAFDANSWENAFKGVPAIICGAGPSLNAAFPHLKSLQDKALILAGGSAITALVRAGISPHLALALDPNPEEFDRLQPLSGCEVPFLFAPRLQKDVLSLFKGPIGYLQTCTGGLVEEWLLEKLDIPRQETGPDLGREAFSVTTLAVAYAYFLGCDPIILSGVDLSFTGGRRYASGVPCDDTSASPRPAGVLDQLLIRDGRETLLKWVMEAEALGAFAKNHPERQFFNSTTDGLEIPGISHCSLNTLKTPVDLRFSFQKMRLEAEILPLWIELKESLERCIEQMQKTKKQEYLPLLLSDEPAYRCFIEAIAIALERILERFLSHEPNSRESVKWKETTTAALEILRILEEFVAQSASRNA